MADHPCDRATEKFVAYRNLLFTVAYEMLGSAADAEDVLQEVWLRWATVDQARVRDDRAFLLRITTRTAIDRLRTLKRRREAYVGPWLPEPLITAPDVAEDVELAEDVSIAILLLLETLSPTERAVFVLREAFGFPYEEIAAAVGKSTAAVRQVAHRARRHVEARCPRESVSPTESRAVVESFQRALETGDFQSLLDVLAPDVVLLADGGGLRRAARRPVRGAETVTMYASRAISRRGVTLTTELALVNGTSGLLVRVDGALDGVLAMRVERNGIAAVYYVRNPEKLTRITAETSLVRR